MANLPSLVDMLKSGMHFGHSTSRWHPKMKSFIFGSRQGVHIIDLEKTQVHLADALETLKGIASRGGVILFVGTKLQAKGPVQKYAEACGMPFVINRWLGGTLTNFVQIKQTLKRMKMLKDQRDKGELKKYTKKERLMISREIEEMEEKFGGIENITRTPDAIFIIDLKTEKTALKEANVTGIPVIALCDTNVNPDGVAKIIPGNDDAVKSIELICKLACDAIKDGKASAAKVAADARVKTIKKVETTS
ncbi:30S ribosomal protein S2 [Candidatus Uhrbacteria bacterium CG10_big_fil_rev_8_21_14_0_10_48_16]|uniref:Small ribosomal subunit protein uS2 n=1 Tax=Candidatus Uhrbacteria bacterium CG10_big_fil_rev_8_21_14_0_10_48_16 TaxID=1975038 RepID=A0A2M8LH23_9BACT|nr:MAG: 30S ribosomal protein S2 [Candidatus Uhrbacteria bacterium CG10_big_fil_rev_8_21_14_0_10_48_16]